MAKKKHVTKTAKRIESLLRQVRRMESRNYWWEGDIRQEIKNLSPQKARFFTTETLYKKAMGVDVETGEVLTGTEARKRERQRTAQKAAETRKRKKQEEAFKNVPEITEPVEPEQQKPAESEEPYDITQDVVNNFRELLDFFARPLPDDGKTKDGKTVPKFDTLDRYGVTIKTYIRQIFDKARAQDEGALAKRIYDNSDIIDEQIGVIEYSMYKESLRIAGNQLIKIIRGTAILSDQDRRASESMANEEWTDYS